MLKQNCVVVAMALWSVAAAVGCSFGSELKLTYEGAKDQSLDAKSGYAYPATKTFSAPDGKGGFSSSKAANYAVFVANFQLNPNRGTISLGEPLTATGQMRVQFALVGEEGTEAGGKKNDPLATGEYTPGADKYRKVDYFFIHVFGESDQVQHRFDIGKSTGSVKVTVADEQLIRGEIDLKDGKNAVRGPFKARISGR